MCKEEKWKFHLDHQHNKFHIKVKIHKDLDNKAIKGSQAIKAEKQAQILELLAKCKPLAKFVNNPIVRKGAGIFAGLSAATTLAGSTAKIVDTYGYLSSQNVA